jgi:hypothetical protein
MNGRGSDLRLIWSVGIADPASAPADLMQLDVCPVEDGDAIERLDAMRMGQRQGESLLLFGSGEFIYVDHVKRLPAGAVATPVARGLPASDKTPRQEVSHHCSPSGDY